MHIDTEMMPISNVRPAVRDASAVDMAQMQHTKDCRQRLRSKVQAHPVQPVKASADHKLLQKRVLILISDTGGGHRASAQALEAAFEEVRPGEMDVRIVDIWTDYGKWPYNKFVPGYQFVAKNPILWRTMYFSSAMPVVKPFLQLQTRIACYRSFKGCIEQHDPHLIVSMHPLCQEVPLSIVKKQQKQRDGRHIPFATVITDLGSAHPTWFHKGVDMCFVPSDAVRSLARRRGVAESQLRQLGLPVRPAFWKEAEPRAKLEQELGLTEGRKTVLVVGGGDGVGSLDKIVDATATQISRACPDEAQLVVVCGKNAKMQQRIMSQTWDHVDVQVRGFIKRMSDYMAVSDCIVTKAGPGTIAEAAIRGLPTMLSSFLPGQEAGNVPFVTRNGFGDYSKKPKVIARTVCDWLQDPKMLSRMSTNARAVSMPQASTAIAQELCMMIDSSEVNVAAQHF